jgi:hypothetical protein
MYIGSRGGLRCELQRLHVTQGLFGHDSNNIDESYELITETNTQLLL